jgi:hypothetical protein
VVGDDPLDEPVARLLDAGVDRRSDAVFCSPRCKVRAWRRRAEPFGERSQ